MKTTRNELKLRADKCPIKRFKAFIGKANTQATLCADTGIEIIGWSGFDASDLNAKSHRVELARFIAAADPETILALLAELEAKNKRIAELESCSRLEYTRRVERENSELKAKLATPVRLTDERKAFEYFVIQRFGDLVDRRRAKNGDNEYMAWDMAMSWIVWQRRAAMLAAAPESD